MFLFVSKGKYGSALNNNVAIICEHVVDICKDMSSELRDVGVVDDALVSEVIFSLISMAINDFLHVVLTNFVVNEEIFVLDAGSAPGLYGFLGIFLSFFLYYWFSGEECLL